MRCKNVTCPVVVSFTHLPQKTHIDIVVYSRTCPQTSHSWCSSRLTIKYTTHYYSDCVMLQSTSMEGGIPVFSSFSKPYPIFSLDRAPTNTSNIGDLSPYCPCWTPTHPGFFFCSSLPDWDVITLLPGQYPWIWFLLWPSFTFFDDAAWFPSIDHCYHEHCPVSILSLSLLFYQWHCHPWDSSIYTHHCVPTSPFFLFLTFLLHIYKASTPVALSHRPLYSLSLFLSNLSAIRWKPPRVRLTLDNVLLCRLFVEPFALVLSLVGHLLKLPSSP